MSLLTRYVALLRGTGAGPALLASLVGRLSLGTTGLALLLLVRLRTSSYASAGLVAAAFALSFAACAPARARRADRRGPRGVLLACAVLHPLTLVGVVLLARAQAGAAVLTGAALLAGGTVPPLGGVMRALWAGLAERDARVDVATAYSLEAVVVEVCFLSGPLLVAGLGATLGPEAAVLASAGLVLAGGLGLAAAPAVRDVAPHPDAVHSMGGPLVAAQVRRLLLAVAFVGVGFGALDVAVVAFAEASGRRPTVGAVLLALLSAGSIAGGLAYGALAPAAAPARQLSWLMAALATGAVLPLLAPGPVALGLLLLVYGTTIAPWSACNAVLLGAAAPVGTVTEAFAWSSSAIFAGASLGNVLAGLVVEHAGARSGLGLTAASGLLALAASRLGAPPRDAAG